LGQIYFLLHPLTPIRLKKHGGSWKKLWAIRERGGYFFNVRSRHGRELHADEGGDGACSR
jgi:hypothetical protein